MYVCMYSLSSSLASNSHNLPVLMYIYISTFSPPSPIPCPHTFLRHNFLHGAVHTFPSYWPYIKSFDIEVRNNEKGKECR